MSIPDPHEPAPSFQPPKDAGFLRKMIAVPLVAHFLCLGYVYVFEAPMLEEAARKPGTSHVATKSGVITYHQADAKRHLQSLPWLYGREIVVLFLLGLALWLVGLSTRYGTLLAMSALLGVQLAVAVAHPTVYEALWENVWPLIFVTATGDLVLLVALGVDRFWWRSGSARA